MDLVKPFLIGGSVIAGSKLISKFVSPALAPLVGGMPTGIIATFFLDNDEQKRKYYDGYAYSSFVLFLAILLIHMWSRHSDLSVNVISIVSLLAWAIMSYFVVNFFVLTSKKTPAVKNK
jgi:hypothetical protein